MERSIPEVLGILATSELLILSLILSVIFVLLGILDAITTKKGLLQGDGDVKEKNQLMARYIKQSPSNWFKTKILCHIAIASLSILASTTVFLMKAPAFVSLILILVLLILNFLYAYVVVHNYARAYSFCMSQKS